MRIETWIALGLLVVIEGGRLIAWWRRERPLEVSALWGKELEYTEGRKGWRV